MLDGAKIIPRRVEFDGVFTLYPGANLTQVNASDPFDSSKFAARDGELAYRDLVVAAKLLQLSTAVSTVWALPVERLQIPSVALESGFHVESSDRISSNTGAVVHVLNASVPIDAFTTDKALYNRDILLAELLYRAGEVLESNPLSQVDPSVTFTEAWSQAEGAQSQQTVSVGLPLNTSLFKTPDANLADRDNQLASYCAVLQDALREPLAYASRIVIEITGTDAREAETYCLASDTGTVRTFVAEPALPGAMTVAYHKVNKTLSWVSEDAVSYTPEEFAALLNVNGTTNSPVVPGHTGGQEIELRTSLLEELDAAYWWQKAAKLETSGVRSNTLVSTPEAVWLYSPGTTVFSLGSDLAPGTYKVSLLCRAYNPSHAGVGAQTYNLTARIMGTSVSSSPQGFRLVSLPDRAEVACFQFTLYSTYSSPVLEVTYMDPAQSLGLWINRLQLSLSETITGHPNSSNFPGWKSELLRRAGNAISGAVTRTYKRLLNVDNLPAPRDSFDDRQEVAFDYHAILVGDNTVFTKEEGEPNHGGSYGGKSGWWKWTPTSSGTVTINASGSSFIPLLGVYTGSAVDELTTVQTGVTSISFSAVAGTAYSIAIDSYNGESGSIVVDITSPPANDNFASAFTLSNFMQANGTTVSASKESGELAHAGNAGGHSVWYAWTARAYNKVRLTVEAEFNPLIAAYTGSSLGTLVEVASVQDTVLEFTAIPGTVYHFVIDGKDGESGVFKLIFEPEFRFYGSPDYIWQPESSAQWYQWLQGAMPRVMSAFRLAGPGDVGFQGLLPSGISYDTDNHQIIALQHAPVPVISTIQPWMIDYNVYVAKHEFVVPASADGGVGGGGGGGGSGSEDEFTTI